MTGLVAPSRPARLLVVDDAPEITRLVARLGARHGCEVQIAADVPAAWQVLQAWRPDLVLLDLNLPGENGLVLCRRLRQSADLAALSVALFGDWQRTEDIVEGLEAGVDFVVAKDLLCRPDAWEARLREILVFVTTSAGSIGPAGKTAIALPVEAALRGLDEGLQALAARHLTGPVVRLLLQRASRALLGSGNGATSPPEQTGSGERRRLWQDPVEVATLLDWLADHLWRLGGRALAEPFEQAVRAACPEAAALWT